MSGARCSEGGFTLIEVVVALAVLVIALGAGVSLMSRSARTTGALQDSLFAHWVATNALVEQTLLNAATAPARPPPQRTVQNGTEFVVNVVSTTKPDEWTRSVTITVARTDSPTLAPYTLQSDLPLAP